MKTKLLLLIIIFLTYNDINSQIHKLNSVNVDNNYKAEMLYDENGKNTSYKEYTFNSTTNEWEYDLYGKDYYYNSEGLIDYIIFEESTYHNKYEYSYNSDNKLIEITMSDQNSSNWDLRYTDTYIYNNSNNNVEFIRNFANPSTWNVNYRYLNTFDGNNNLILKEKQEWNTNTNSWNATNKKYEYSYNSNNKIVNRLTKILVNGNFEQVGKFQYIYDANGNRVEWSSYYYDNGWIPEEKVTYTYDNNYSLSDLILPNWQGIMDFGYDEDYNHMILTKSYSEWDATQNQWTNPEDAIFNWSDTTASINSVETSIVKFYPNPVNEQLNFDLPNIQENTIIEIFNSQGKLILKKKLEENLDVSNLNKGIYIFSIDNKNKGKFIKQ